MSKRYANQGSKGKTNRIKGGFVLFRYDVIDSPAFADLSGNAVRVFVALKRAFNGKNNGEIIMSCRMLNDKIGMSRATASRALKELQTHGFVRITRPGWYAGHVATIWELTETHNNMCSDYKDLWRQWRPGIDCRALDSDYCGLVSPDKNQNKVPNMQQDGNEVKPVAE